MPTGHNDDQPEALYPTSGRRIGTGLQGEPDTPARDASMATARERLGWPAETEPVRFVSPAGSVAITHFGESPAWPRALLRKSVGNACHRADAAVVL